LLKKVERDTSLTAKAQSTIKEGFMVIMIKDIKLFLAGKIGLMIQEIMHKTGGV
jgi:hypothetical protein